MGHGIAQTFALAGYEVACFDESATTRDSLIERVRDNLAAFVAAGLVESQRGRTDRLLAFSWPTRKPRLLPMYNS